MMPSPAAGSRSSGLATAPWNGLPRCCISAGTTPACSPSRHPPKTPTTTSRRAGAEAACPQARRRPVIPQAGARAQADPAAFPKPATAGRQPDADAPAGAYDRHIGTVTLDGQTHDCEHGARNGHMDTASAETCAKRLLRNYPGGVTGTRLHPVRRDRNGARVTA